MESRVWLGTRETSKLKIYHKTNVNRSVWFWLMKPNQDSNNFETVAAVKTTHIIRFIYVIYKPNVILPCCDCRSLASNKC